MRTSIALTWVAAAALALTGCAAQNQTRAPDTSAAVASTPFSYKAHISIEPGPTCPAYPAELRVFESTCPMSHPYYRDAHTLVVGPAPGAELDVTLKPRCPALQGKATVTIVRLPPTGKYFLGSRPITCRSLIVLNPGEHDLYLWVMGSQVKVAELNLRADIDYLACVGES